MKAAIRSVSFNIIILIIILQSASTLSQPLFTKTDFKTGNLPIWVELSDFNGDSKPDLVVVNHDDNTISIFLNTTAQNAVRPSFSENFNFETGFTPYVVAVSDFNGDGKPDLAVTNISTPSSFSVLINKTEPNSLTPSFTEKVDFTTGQGPFSAAISDINNDGKPDIVTTNSVTPYAVSVFFNTTSAGDTVPSFSSGQNFATGNKPQSVALPDFNGDGKPDMAVANREDNTVSVFLNTTPDNSFTASFAPKINLAAGVQPYSIGVSDINGDGKPDLAVTDSSSSAVSIFINKTLGNSLIPEFTLKTEFTTGRLPVAILFSDFNKDGKEDMVVANYKDNSISVFINSTETNSTVPVFNSKVDFITGKSPMSVAVADINGDSKPDLVTANFAGNTVSVFLNKFIITSTEENGVSYPAKFLLTQNFPNPFNPSTKIEYSIPNSTFVKLIVYDLLGREVTTLVNKQRPAGIYKVDFDASNMSSDSKVLTSGVYLYRITAGKFIQTKKMLLLK